MAGRTTTTKCTNRLLW